LDRYLAEYPETALLDDLAMIFGKGHTHMIGADVANARSVTFFLTTYLTAGAEKKDQLMLGSALTRIGIDKEIIREFLNLHRVLGSARPGTLFFSWPASANDRVVRAKIDYSNVRIGLVAELMGAVNARDQADNALKWGQRLNVVVANYAGLVINDKGLDQARAYFTIRSPNYLNHALS
jgi:hypothetical protein